MNDYEEFRQLLQAYSRAVDDRDIEALEGLFHPEATIAGARGSQTLSEWLETMRAPRTFPTSMHVLGEPLVTYTEGADRAALDTYAVVYQIGDKASGGGDLTLGIRYLDELVRVSYRWKLWRRVSNTLWMR